MNSLPILKYKCRIAVLGLGYVGLPVLTVFANQRNSLLNKQKLELNLIGFDINKKRIKELKKELT